MVNDHFQGKESESKHAFVENSNVQNGQTRTFKIYNKKFGEQKPKFSEEHYPYQLGLKILSSNWNSDLKPIVSSLSEQDQNLMVKMTSMKIQSRSSDEISIPRDYPITKIPLSLINIMLEKPENFDFVLRNMCKTLNGELNVKRGYFTTSLDSETTIKVSGFRDTITNNVYIEFNRLEGCAFKFQKAFVNAKISVIKYIKGANEKEFKEELKLVEERLKFWNSPTKS